MRFKNIWFILLFLIPATSFSFSIEGRVLRRDNMDVVDNASAILKQDTNIISYIMVEDDGSFLFEDLSVGHYLLEIKAPGFYTEKQNITLLSKNQKLRLFLSPQSTLYLGEVEVVGEKNKGTVSKTAISQEIREKSQTSITGDPLTILGNLPGVDFGNSIGLVVVGVHDGSGGGTPFSVRGGNGTENIAFLDDALIPYPYHRTFPDSVFIDSIVGDMALYKGILPANYGQAMSSLLDIQMIEPTSGIHGKLNLGLLNTYLTLNGLDRKNHLSWIAGIRRTHYDLLLGLITSIIQPKTASQNIEISFPYYVDTQGKITYQISSDQVRLLWQASLEPTQVKYPAISNNFHLKLDYQNATADLKWKHTFSPSLFLQNSAQWIGSYFYTALSLTNLVIRSNALDVPRDVTNKTLFYDADSRANLRFQSEVSWEFLPHLKLRSGAEVYYLPTIQYSNLIQRTVETTNTSVTNITNVYVAALYTNMTVTNVEGLTFSYKQTNASSLVYNESYLLFSPFTLMEMEFFNGKLRLYPGIRLNYINYLSSWNIDPRFTAQFIWNKNQRTFFAAGMLSQFSLNATQIAQLKDFKTNLQMPRVFQAVVGHEWKFLNSYKLNVETYYKDYDFIITQKTNSQGDTIYQSSGYDKRVGGLEIILTKNPDTIPIYGWLSFGSYQIWEYRESEIIPYYIEDFQDFQNIYKTPENEWFLKDIRNYRVNLNLIWDINKFWSLNTSFDWKSGDRITPITNMIAYIDPFTSNQIVISKKGTYSSVRLPDEHSLSLKLEYHTQTFNLPSGIYIQMQNIYNLWFFHTSTTNSNVIVTDFDSRKVTGVSYNYDPNAPNGVSQEYRHSFLGFFVTFGFWMKW